MKLTEDRENQLRGKYVARNGVICPFCNSDDLDPCGKYITNVEGNITQLVECLGCGKTWTDVYSLTGMEFD